MELFYRLLGVAAATGSRESRESLNGIPLHHFPLFILAVLLFVVFGTLLDSREPQQPQPVPIRDLQQFVYNGPRYVALKGLFRTAEKEGFKQKTAEGDTVVSEALTVVFEDLERKHGILIEIKKSTLETLDFRDATLTGMLRTLDPFTLDAFPETAKKLSLSSGYYLEVGAKPYRWGAVSYVLLALAVPLAFYAVATLKGYVIFRPEPRTGVVSVPVAAGPAPGPADLRGSGRFQLEGRTHERFNSIPVQLGAFDDGSLGLTTQVDASRTWSLNFRQVGREERAGTWLLWIGRGTVKNLQCGRQYLGWGSRPAVRFTYGNACTRGTDVAVISFATEQERAAVLASLQSLSA